MEEVPCTPPSPSFQDVVRYLEAAGEGRAGISAGEYRQLLRACHKLLDGRRASVVLTNVSRKQRKQVARAECERRQQENVLRGECSLGSKWLPDEDVQLGVSEENEAKDSVPEFFLRCYCCKRGFVEVPKHDRYDSMCEDCGRLNLEKREARCELVRGRVALVTGGRIKIGFETALKLLRDGCFVIVTTRFARDCEKRYRGLSDFGEWEKRLRILEYDFSSMEAVEKMCAEIVATVPTLDFIIHNACQTIRRPAEYYAHLRGEQSESAQFPNGEFDKFGQQIDLRATNSWRMLLCDVPVAELTEVMQVNAMAPFIITARLRPLMERVFSPDCHIVFVSAVEGQFYKRHKTPRHVHTNCAKAAVNMLVRTSAQEFIRSGIHLNSVDTGWVTNESPTAMAARMTSLGFSNPLDCVDGAARVLDPIYSGLMTGMHPHGLFFKDYFPTLF